jgi:hypothetical protein
MLLEFEQRTPNTDIILSETWLDEAESVYLRGFDVVRKGRNETAGGGVAIFINNLKYSCKDGLYDGDGKIEACSIELYTGQDKILIVSCYKQPQMKIELMVWKKFFAKFKGKFLISMDIIIRGVIRKTVLPATTCTIVSPNWKQTLRR